MIPRFNTGRSLPVATVIEHVAFEFERDAGDILGTGRHRRLSWARYAIAWLACHHTRATIAEIGAAMAGRDRGTVAQQIERATAWRQRDCLFLELTDRLDAMLVSA